MPSSFQDYTGNGAALQWAVPFPYLNRAHVAVTNRSTGVAIAFTWVNDTTISISPAVANGTTFRVQRNTPVDQALVSFNDGSNLREDDLETSQLQLLYSAQEVSEEQDEFINTAASEAAAQALAAAETAINDAIANLAFDDNTLPGAKLVDGSVTTSKLANGVVTSAKVDAALLAALQADRNDMPLLAVADTTGVGAVEFTTASGVDPNVFRGYMLVVHRWVPSAASTIRLQFRVNGSWVTSGYSARGISIITGVQPFTLTDGIPFSFNNPGTGGAGTYLAHITAGNSNENFKSAHISGYNPNAVGSVEVTQAGGHISLAGALDGVRLTCSSGTVSAIVALYGLRRLPPV